MVLLAGKTKQNKRTEQMLVFFDFFSEKLNELYSC